VNSRIEDISDAAVVVRGKKVADGVEFYISAASNEVEAESRRRGDWQILIDAGAIPLPPGCGPCIGLGRGLLQPGEIGISATNRNFKGRMGAREAQAYLASPAVVAASAVSGKITGPKQYDTVQPVAHLSVRPIVSTVQTVSLLPGMPSEIKGELLYCYQDNMNTDGIYPGKYTYIDTFTPEQQAAVAMENYDPEFQKKVKQRDILVGGENFGTGSSREQAATALKYRGIQLVIAVSFNETYKRNAINNGFLTIECPELVYEFSEMFGKKELTVRTGIMATIDLMNSSLIAGAAKYMISPVGPTAQELMLVGGLEEWIKKKITV
jgi:homoaconitate hydratase